MKIPVLIVNNLIGEILIEIIGFYNLVLGKTILNYKKAVKIFKQIRKFQIFQLILEILFFILSYFWILAMINFNNGGDANLVLNLTNFYFILIFLILYIEIEIGYKYEELRCLDFDAFPDLFIPLYLVGIIFSLGIKLIPILLLMPSWIFYHEWLLRPLILYIAIFSIILPFPYIILRQFLEKDSDNNYRAGPFPLKSQIIFLIVYSIIKLFNFYIMYQIMFGSLNMSNNYYSIYYYIQIGLAIFVLIIQLSMIDLISRLKSNFSSALNK